MYKYIICDCNLWYHRNFNTHKDMTYKVNKKTMITGGIYGMLQSIQKWKRLFGEDCQFYFLFDNPETKSNLRAKLIDPTYKMSRHKYSSTFYKGLDFLHFLLLYSSDNYHTVYGTGYESDDIVPYILNKLPIDENNQVIMISEDMDWSRLISDNVHQFMKDRIFDKISFNNHYGFLPNTESVTMYKVFRGDKVDDIPIGVKMIPKNHLLKIIDDYHDIYEVLDNLPIMDLPDKWKQDIIANKDTLTLNYKLVSFFPVEKDQVEDFIEDGSFKPKTLKKLYSIVGFKDLSYIDRRLYNIINEEKVKKLPPNKRFFQQPKVKRK